MSPAAGGSGASEDPPDGSDDALARRIAERGLGPATGGVWGPLATPVHLDPPLEEAGGVPWRENVFVSWWDPARRVCGIGQYSTSPNGPGSRARMTVGVAGRTAEVVEPVAWGTHSSASHAVDLEGVFSVDHPDLRVELHQEPLVPPIDFTTTRAVAGLAEDVFPLHHYQQPVRTRGVVVLDGEEHPFEGLGWRDRTWGFRDESVSWVDYTIVTVLVDGDDEAVVLLKMLDGDGRLRESAFAVDRDGQRPLGAFTFVRNARGLLAEAFVDAPGGRRTFTVTGSLGGFWNPLGDDRQTGPTCSVYDEFVTFRTDDGRTATGLCEHGIVRRVF